MSVSLVAGPPLDGHVVDNHESHYVHMYDRLKIFTNWVQQSFCMRLAIAMLLALAMAAMAMWRL